ncbi:Uncharacterised protein [Mycobacteroides abscessus subsp. abscessus]|nr:Uncharacterised protein [Mycobacteroides abscessus subsp. abscessus]
MVPSRSSRAHCRSSSSPASTRRIPSIAWATKSGGASSLPAGRRILARVVASSRSGSCNATMPLSLHAIAQLPIAVSKKQWPTVLTLPSMAGPTDGSNSPVGPCHAVRPSFQRSPQLRDRGCLFLGGQIGIARDDLDLVLDVRALIRVLAVRAAELFELPAPVGDGTATGRGR